MLALFTFILFTGCIVLAYTRLLLGAVIAFLFPPLVGIVAWFMLQNSVLDTFDDRAFLSLMFLGIVVIVELGLFIGSFLRVI